MLCNWQLSKTEIEEKKRKGTILKDTKDGPGFQRESFGNNTDSEGFVRYCKLCNLPFNNA